MKIEKTPIPDQPNDPQNDTAPTAKRKRKWQRTNHPNLMRDFFSQARTLHARIRIGGEVKWKSLNTDKITVAKERLADFINRERRMHENQQQVVKGKMTFKDALAIYRERLQGDAALKPRSKAYREERIKALLKSWPELEDLDVRKISQDDCQKWAARYHKAFSPSNYNHTIGTLRQILQIAVEKGLRYENPAKHIKRKKVLQKPVQLPTTAEFHKILDALKRGKGRFSSDCADLVCFLAYGGFRKSEAARITWADIDFEKGQVRVLGDAKTGTKNWSHRYVHMIPSMKEFLLNLKRQRSEEPLSATVMKIRECQGALNRACKVAGVARITHHDMRHFFATCCIEAAVPIPTVAQWLGHKDGGALAMKTYGHLRNDHGFEMAQKVLIKPLLQQPNVIPLTPEPQEKHEPNEATAAVRAIQSGNLDKAMELLGKVLAAKERQDAQKENVS